MIQVGPQAMTQEEYLLLNELITDELGVSFPEHKREMLESRLRPRLQALRLARFIEYYFLLQAAGDAAEAEKIVLASLVTNNETYFFRETQQFDALFGQALADLKPGAATPGSLRVLIAGCSSGEEAYSLGFVARQHFVSLAGTALTIDAFDIDSGRVAMARSAEYGGGSFRATSPEQLERCFVPAGTARWAVKLLFQSGVRFFRGNILDLATFAAPIAYDVVFCRNVLIYFSEAALHRAVANFAAVLRPGGVLFLGHAESIIGLSPCFASLRLGNGIAYRKVAG
jgi:chemotaxis protein methyltransferase CheR